MKTKFKSKGWRGKPAATKDKSKGKAARTAAVQSGLRPQRNKNKSLTRVRVHRDLVRGDRQWRKGGEAEQRGPSRRYIRDAKRAPQSKEPCFTGLRRTKPKIKRARALNFSAPAATRHQRGPTFGFTHRKHARETKDQASQERGVET